MKHGKEGKSGRGEERNEQTEARGKEERGLKRREEAKEGRRRGENELKRRSGERHDVCMSSVNMISEVAFFS